MWNFFGVISEVGYYREFFLGIDLIADIIQIFSHDIPAMEDDRENIGGSFRAIAFSFPLKGDSHKGTIAH